jgi:hypothetical protein
VAELPRALAHGAGDLGAGTRWGPDRVPARGGTPETIVWATAAEALLPAATLFADGPCSGSCTRHHSVVWADEHGLHVRPVRGDPPPPSVATELHAL